MQQSEADQLLGPCIRRSCAKSSLTFQCQMQSSGINSSPCRGRWKMQERFGIQLRKNLPPPSALYQKMVLQFCKDLQPSKGQTQLRSRRAFGLCIGILANGSYPQTIAIYSKPCKIFLRSEKGGSLSIILHQNAALLSWRTMRKWGTGVPDSPTSI